VSLSFFEELKRRNVFRVGIAYAVASWLLLQIVDLVLENINAPDWVMQVFMLALAVGFPIAVIIAWAFEVTPEGVRLEKNVDRSQSISTETGKQLNRGIIVILSVAVVFLLTDKFRSSPQGSGSISPEKEVSTEIIAPKKTARNPAAVEKSVAVLPFINMSDDQQNEYFSDGISEELLNVLVRVKGLRVPSRTSSFSFKGSRKKLSDIGKELHVDHVLEGSVRKDAGRIRVTAQLIEVNTDTHLWSETYTRELNDIFAVQDEIAHAIVGALKITLTGSEQASIGSRPTTNVEAYNNYLLGRHLWNQRTSDSLLAAVKPLKTAVEMDAGFGEAWAALADTYVLMPEYNASTISESIPLAHEAIQKALSINPDSARALTTSAYVSFMFDYDLETAHADFQKAIAIEPGYATAHQWYGELLAVESRLDEAVDQFHLAQLADPLAPIIPHDTGWILSNSERRDEAFSYMHKALELGGIRGRTIRNLVILNILKGNFDQARKRAYELVGSETFDYNLHLAIIDAVEEPTPKHQQRALDLLRKDTGLSKGTAGKARYLMLINEPELALQALEDAFAEGDPYAIHMKRMDIFQPLHDKPRFQALLKKMNLWP